MDCHYLAIDGNILEASIDDRNSLHIKSWTLDQTRNELTVFCEFSWPSKLKVDLLEVSEILEESTCRRIPVAFVTLYDEKASKKAERTCYLMYIDTNKEKCVALRRFSLQRNVLRQIEKSNNTNNLFLSDGPSVILIRKSFLYLYSGSVGVNLSPSKFTLLQNCEDGQHCVLSARILSCKSLFRCKIIMVAFTTNMSCSSCHILDSQSICVLEFKDGNFSVLDASRFIPTEFHTSLNSIHVCDSGVTNQSVITSQIYASTNTGFILSLKNGHLVTCTFLSQNPSQVFLQDETRQNIPVNAIQAVDQCFVMAKQDHDFTILDQQLQVKKVYTDFHHVFHGDFTGSGTIQVLFVKSQTILSSEWTLDDFNMLCINSSDTGISTCGKVDNSMNTAIKALQSRLQQDALLLMHREQSLYKKKEFLAKTGIKQVKLSSGYCPKDANEKRELLTLIESPAPGMTNTRTKDGDVIHSVLEVCKTWQTTYNNKWCIGVEFYWKSKSSAEVWLQLAPGTSQCSLMTTCSKYVVCPSQTTHKKELHTQPGGPKRRKTNDSVMQCGDISSIQDIISEPVMYTVTCVTDIPMFSQVTFIAVSLLLKWQFRKSTNSESSFTDLTENECSISEFDLDGARVLTLCCGSIVLDSDDIVTGKWEMPVQGCSGSIIPADLSVDVFKDMHRNKLVRNCVQTCTNLEIRSSAGVLAQLEQLVKDRCHFLYNLLHQIFTTDSTTLNKTQFELPPLTCDLSRNLRVYTGSETELYLLIHHLYRNLPDNIVILTSGKRRKHLRDILPMIQQENNFFLQEIRKLISDHVESSADGNVDKVNSHEDVRNIAERFKRKREEFENREDRCVDASHLELLLNQLSLYKNRTDVAIVQNTVKNIIK